MCYPPVYLMFTLASVRCEIFTTLYSVFYSCVIIRFSSICVSVLFPVSCYLGLACFQCSCVFPVSPVFYISVSLFSIEFLAPPPPVYSVYCVVLSWCSDWLSGFDHTSVSRWLFSCLLLLYLDISDYLVFDLCLSTLLLPSPNTSPVFPHIVHLGPHSLTIHNMKSWVALPIIQMDKERNK